MQKTDFSLFKLVASFSLLFLSMFVTPVLAETSNAELKSHTYWHPSWYFRTNILRSKLFKKRIVELVGTPN